MNPMADALKKKRMGLVDMSAPEGHMDGSDEGHGGKDLLGMVASLSEQERGKLKDILSAAGTGNEQGIAKGDPSSEEQMKIQQQVGLDKAKVQASDNSGAEPGDEAAEAEVNPDPAHQSDQSDDIAKSMLDSKYNNGPITAPPRNLGERMKNAVATKLKGKGKL